MTVDVGWTTAPVPIVKSLISRVDGGVPFGAMIVGADPAAPSTLGNSNAAEPVAVPGVVIDELPWVDVGVGVVEVVLLLEPQDVSRSSNAKDAAIAIDLSAPYG